MKDVELILRGTATLAGAIGYGEVYKFQIRKVMFGNLNEKEISITILANNQKYSSFISSHLSPIEFEIGFSKRGNNEIYSFLPINGFVDKNKHSWEIEYLNN